MNDWLSVAIQYRGFPAISQNLIKTHRSAANLWGKCALVTKHFDNMKYTRTFEFVNKLAG